MRYDNFYVSNLIISSYVLDNEEKYFILESRICRKVKNGYIDIETQRIYSDEQKKGIDRVIEDTLIPLSSYFNILGFKKKNNYNNKDMVYSRVKHLKSQRKI